MATQASTASVFAWTSVIEALARCKQLDASTVIDLFNEASEISNGFGKNAREMVSFRVLESLYPETEITESLSSAPKSTVGFNLSESCEDVLMSISKETPGSNLRDEAEKLKWQAHPFITRKRSCLQKCALDRLRDAILDDSHPFLASLKRRSGLVPPDRSGNRIDHDNDDGDCNGISQRIQGTDVQTVTAKGPSVMESPENSRALLQNLSHIKSSTAKRDSSDLAAEFIGKLFNENPVTEDNGCHTYLNPAKKLKQDSVCIGQAVDQKIVLSQVSESVEDESGRTLQHMGREGCELPEELLAGGLEVCNIAKDGLGNDDKVEVSSIDEDDLGNYGAIVIYQQQIPGDHGKLPQDISEGQANREYVDDKEEDSKGCNDMRTLNGEAKDDVENSSESALSNDSDGYHEEMTDIGTKKNAFLSSKCRHRDGLSVTTNWKELNLCMKCNKGGQLLVCSSDACPFVVHDSCCSTTIINTGEQFYCPFCRYSRLISEYRVVKEKASLARNDLVAFFGLEMKVGPKNLFNIMHVSEQNYSIRSRNQALQSSYLEVPQIRRKAVPWTQLEEETLKKGVKKFSNGGARWKKILEDGGIVFQKGRTAVDLKDKWRNLCKGNGKA